MENKIVKLCPTANWSDYTFIFASVSIGNIGQLATDLLISSLQLVKCGYLISEYVQPIVGHDAFIQNSNDFSLSCELYENSTLKIVVMQQRAPLFKGKRNDFVNFLSEFTQNERFKEIICLTSTHAYERLDSQLTGIQCRYLSTNTEKISNEKTEWIALEKRIDHNNNNPELAEKDNLTHFMPGGGIAQKWWKISQDKNLNSTILIVFAHEGNNIPEAMQLANYLDNWKGYLEKLSMKSWRLPISWQFVFGQNIDPMTKSQMF